MTIKYDVLSWLHVGDLHITDETEQNYRDLLRIVALADGLADGSVDFAVLPGDNADDGTPEQYRLVRKAMSHMKMPVHILPGDHDFKPRALDDFHDVLGAERLPKVVVAHGHRCLFLDVVSAGSGGPDFRLDEAQIAWAEREVREASMAGQAVAVFMHTYPADLREGAARLGALLAQPQIVCVDMGHTHYNELSNDGGTIFMATRSTGQIEEGPAGFSIAAIDGGGVSWRFKTLDRAWPFVLVTSPVDHRLVTDAGQVGSLGVRAKVFSDASVESVMVRADDGAWLKMSPVPGATALWEATLPSAAATVRVRAWDAKGRDDEDRVEPAGRDWAAPPRTRDGSDADRIEAWPDKGIVGGQLGPNRNGRKW